MPDRGAAPTRSTARSYHCRLLLLLCLTTTTSTAADSLYERLGLSKGASSKEIKKAWHLVALKLHPDKVEGSSEQKDAAERRFKQAAEAYEVLSDGSLRATYDRTGVIPDDKAKTEATSKKSSSSEDDEYGFEGAGGGNQQQQQRGWHQQSRYGWRFDAFEIGLAQKRARRVRTLEQLRKLLQPPGGGERRFGLVGFYRRGEEGALKQGLRFPYPFAGWSLASQGDGFWWEDAVQSCLVSVGDLASNEGAALLEHFGLKDANLASSSLLPAVAWVGKDDAMSFTLATSREVPTHEAFVGWVYKFLGAEVKVVNKDFRNVKAWWLDGNSAKENGIIKPGESYVRSSFISHRWFFWPEATEGNILGHGAALGMITLSKVGEKHELILEPKCVDANGHCGQWKQLGECERNPGYMGGACPNSCGGCDIWGWLYPAGLGQLHERLACWADAGGCAASKGYPPGGKALRSVEALRAMPLSFFSWLRSGSGGAMDANMRRALDVLLAPPPAPPPKMKASSVAPPPRDEL